MRQVTVVGYNVWMGSFTAWAHEAQMSFQFAQRVEASDIGRAAAGALAKWAQENPDRGPVEDWVRWRDTPCSVVHFLGLQASKTNPVTIVGSVEDVAMMIESERL